MTLSKSKPSRQPAAAAGRQVDKHDAADSRPLVLRIDTKTMDLTPPCLRDSAMWQKRLRQIRKAEKATLTLDALVSWSQQDAELLLAGLAGTPQTLTYLVDAKATRTVTRALVRLLRQVKLKTERRAIVGYLALAIALRSMDQPATADEVRELREAYRVAKIQVPTVAELKAEINDIRSAMLLTRSSTPLDAELQGLFAGYPAVASLVVPPGYELTTAGVRMRGEPVTKTPILPLAVVRIDDQSAETWEVAVLRDGEVRVGVYPASGLLQARTVITLADLGADVTSETSKAIVCWLQALRNANSHALRRIRGTAQLGHQLLRDAHGALTHTFFLGGDVITGGSADAQSTECRFVPRDDGDAEWALYWQSHGELDAWRRAVDPALKSPVARFGVLASLAAALLEILKADNFVASLCGTTTTGKSTVLLLAASVWGRPKIRGGILRTWDTTTVGIERAMSMLRGLPLIVDEAQLIDHTRLNVESILYAVVQGQGRGRGTIHGQALLPSFSTVMLTSGEASLVERGKNQGLLGRVIEVDMLPFGATTEATREMIDTMTLSLEDLYGLLGPEFVRYLLRNQERWPAWQERYQELIKDEISSLEPDAQSHAFRLAKSLAVIRLTSELVQAALDTTIVLSDPVPELRDSIHAVAIGADKFDAVREMLMNAVQQNRRRYPRRSQLGRVGGEFDGVVEDDGRVVYFVPKTFESLVEGGRGLQSSAVLQVFADRGWLVMESAVTGVAKGKKLSARRRFKVKRKLGNAKLQVVAVRVPDSMQFGSARADVAPTEAVWSDRPAQPQKSKRRANS